MIKDVFYFGEGVQDIVKLVAIVWKLCFGDAPWCSRCLGKEYIQDGAANHYGIPFLWI